MHKPVAGPAKPRDILQLIGAVPPALHHLGVYEARNKVMVAQVDPVAAANLASRDLAARGGGRRGRRGDGVEVGCHDRSEYVIDGDGGRG